jgi:hypothetical protein
MYSRHAIVAAILGTVATVGWTVQGLGNAFYFRQARMLLCVSVVNSRNFLADLATSHSSRSLDGEGEYNEVSLSTTLNCPFSSQAKGELASHGAKAYFTRG